MKWTLGLLLSTFLFCMLTQTAMARGMSEELKMHIKHLRTLNKNERRDYFHSLPFEIRQQLKKHKKRRAKKMTRKLRHMSPQQRQHFLSKIGHKKRARLKRLMRYLKTMKFKERQKKWHQMTSNTQNKYKKMNEKFINMEPSVRFEAISELSEQDQMNLSLMQPEANEASVFFDLKGI